MLLSFRVENHKSIREEQQLLLTPVYDDARPEEADWEATTVAGIFGANASGKSNVLDALSFMRNTVQWSFRVNEPGGGMRRHPFELDSHSRQEPSTFVVDLMLDGVRHMYGFSVDDEHVAEEWLYAYPKRRKRVVFEREGAEFGFGDGVSSDLRQVEGITAPNVLFLTVAAQAKQEAVLPVHQWFTKDVVFAAERGPEPPRWLRDGEATEEHMRILGDLLVSAGTGVRSVELLEDDSRGSDFVRFLKRRVGGALAVDEAHRSRGGDDVVVHTATGSGKPLGYLLPVMDPYTSTAGPILLFHHEGEGDVQPLVWGEESLGTRTLAAVGFEAQRVLETGGVFVIDEIDASLHPYLSARIISLFRDERHNPKGAQLVFTSHDAALLGRIRGEEVLKRDHIWFVEKGDEGATTLYPLSDFKPRSDDNRARRYLTGRYGAVPDVDDELFRDALRRRDERSETVAT
ncbi:ATP/GTP-binding protein [Nocardiopsis sp. FIRDI 009]|uniref:AAA family ATPase n=1 Tax=Nocardiopsis sp. FIRDI 009 TaxID=714197 RepID=UPI000E27C433|nr:ATP-binding protein [Nocardiopsis sp. FIRDI 009]